MYNYIIMKPSQRLAIVATASFLLPLVAYAQRKDLNWLVIKITGFFNQALVLLMGLAIVMFTWFVIQYFIKPGDVEARKQAASYVMWSAIGFFVILSFWGIINILQSTFGLQNENNRPAGWASFIELFHAWPMCSLPDVYGGPCKK